MSPRIAWQLTRVGELEQLAERVVQGGVDRPSLRAELQRIGALPLGEAPVIAVLTLNTGATIEFAFAGFA